MDKLDYYIKLFMDNGYKSVRSYGLGRHHFEDIESISRGTITTKQGSCIGWGVCCESAFIDDTFYPYGINRQDVFLEFKRD